MDMEAKMNGRNQHLAPVALWGKNETKRIITLGMVIHLYLPVYLVHPGLYTTPTDATAVVWNSPARRCSCLFNSLDLSFERVYHEGMGNISQWIIEIVVLVWLS
jgi:hypothetical protein